MTVSGASGFAAARVKNSSGYTVILVPSNFVNVNLVLVVEVSLVGRQAYRHPLPKQHSLHDIRAPVDSRIDASESHVGRKPVEFTADFNLAGVTVRVRHNVQAV